MVVVVEVVENTREHHKDCIFLSNGYLYTIYFFDIPFDFPSLSHTMSRLSTP